MSNQGEDVYKRQSYSLAIELKFFMCCKIHISYKHVLISKSIYQFIHCLSDFRKMGKIKRRTVIEFFAKNCQRQWIFTTEKANVLWGAASSKTVFVKWVLEFKHGHTSTEDDPRGGQPKTASIPGIVKQMPYASVSYTHLDVYKRQMF